MAAVRQLYPRSLLRLIVLGNVLVALPLLIAIAYVFINMDRVTARGEVLTREAALAAQNGYELPEDLVHMERLLRQYAVLKEASLLEDYSVARQEWIKISRAFADLPLLADLRAEVLDLLSLEAAAFADFQEGRKAGAELEAVLSELKSRMPRLVSRSNQIISREVETYRTEADALRGRLLLALAAGLAMMVLFFLFSRLLLARVLWGFESAVQALGEGRLDKAIVLKGPRDIREMGERLDWLRRRLLELEEQRILVLRHVSHELKTPLAALREGASLLTEGAVGPLTPGQEKIVGIVRSNALRLQKLIDSLLKLQQAGHAGERIKPVRLRLDKLVQQIVTTHQLTARDKQLHFSGSLKPLVVVGGKEELTTVVDNLISNAIKYSPDGGTVDISLKREEDKVTLDVVDQGPGIPEPDRERVFEPFYRGEHAKGIAGVGLGLAIARQVAAANRGVLELLATTGGSHFRLTLPGEAA